MWRSESCEMCVGDPSSMEQQNFDQIDQCYGGRPSSEHKTCYAKSWPECHSGRKLFFLWNNWILGHWGLYTETRSTVERFNKTTRTSRVSANRSRSRRNCRISGWINSTTKVFILSRKNRHQKVCACKSTFPLWCILFSCSIPPFVCELR